MKMAVRILAAMGVFALALPPLAAAQGTENAVVTSPGESAATADLRLFSIGAGAVTGNYYATVEALCSAMNRAGDRNIRCSAEPTQGSIYNLTALREGQIDFALVQSDWQRYAYAGEMIFASSGPMQEMRAVMSLFPEVLTVLAVRGRGIDSLDDLKGHRIDLGSPASGRRATANAILEGMGLRRSDFPVVMELPIASAYEELCAGRIDASILVLGHPNEALRRVLANCNVELVAVDRQMQQSVAARSPDFRTTQIPAGTYPAQPEAVQSLAVMATLVTRADQPDDIVAKVVEQTLSALPRLAIELPLLSQVTPEQMKTEGLVAPLHAAAAAAYARMQSN